MFRSHQRKSKILFGLTDILLTTAAFELAYQVRQWLPLKLQFFLWQDEKARLLVFCVVSWALLGYWLNVHARLDSARIGAILRDSLRQAGYGTLALAVFITAFKVALSRVFLSLFIVASWLLLAAFRITARNLLPVLRREFGGETNILIVGLGERAERLGRSIEENHAQGLRITGFLAIDEDSARSFVQLGQSYHAFPLADLHSMLARHVIDEIHFAVEADKLPSLEEVFRRCDEEGVCSRIAVDFFPLANGSVELECLGDTPLLTFSSAPGDEVLLLAKRTIDLVVAATAIAVLSPLLLIVAGIIKATSEGPVIFRQVRCGLNGRTFTCCKFRSMVLDAERRVHEVAHLNARTVVMKIPNDPRLTPVGKWLRKFSIDELPQLFNVLKGEMSLVGPRPAIPSEVAQYQRWQRRRLRMRPGMTCLWAVQGRDKVDFESWMRLDLQYIDNWSLGLDARIMLLTIPHVLSGRGAS